MNKLIKGDKAPSFNITDYKNNPVSLKQYQGKQILLCFFRDSSCPFCNLRVQELIKNESKLQDQNIQVLAFFASTIETINKYTAKQNAPFPIIPDPNLNVYKKYHVNSSFKAKLKTMLKTKKVAHVMRSEFFNINSFSTENIVPADFLINDKLIINHAYYGSDFGDHLPLKEIINKQH